MKEISSDLRRLKSATIKTGAVAITVEQAAERLGCSRRRVFELLASGGVHRNKLPTARFTTDTDSRPIPKRR